MLKSIQNAWDNLEKDGTITEELKEKFPRPETNEDAYKILAYSPVFNGWGFNPTTPLLMFLFGMLFGSPGFWGPSLQWQELLRLLNKDKSTEKEESQDKKVDE